MMMAMVYFQHRYPLFEVDPNAPPSGGDPPPDPVTTLAQQMEEQNRRVNAVLEDLQRTTVRVQPQQMQPRPRPNPFTNPDEHAAQIVDERVGWMAQETLAMKAKLARQEASMDADCAEVFRRFGSEIDAELNQSAPMPQLLLIQGNVDAWKKAAGVVYFRHRREIEQAARSGRDFFVETGNNSAPAPTGEMTELPEELQAAASLFHLDPARMLEREKKNPGLRLISVADANRPGIRDAARRSA